MEVVLVGGLVSGVGRGVFWCLGTVLRGVLMSGVDLTERFWGVRSVLVPWGKFGVGPGGGTLVSRGWVWDVPWSWWCPWWEG